jgi:uncharacterized protein YjbI with pentapeptide repeats
MPNSGIRWVGGPALPARGAKDQVSAVRTKSRPNKFNSLACRFRISFTFGRQRGDPPFPKAALAPSLDAILAGIAMNAAAAPDLITLPFSAQQALMLGLPLALFALICAMLFAVKPISRNRAWDEVPTWALAALIAVGALFLTAFVAAGFVLVRTIADVAVAGATGPNLGAGALIATMLGAPFVLYGTWLKHRALGFQKEGHLTDRINKAVEMLGAEKTVKLPRDDGAGSMERSMPNIEVRIGAILSLERIAQDSTAYDKGRDHVRVMEILCAYIRENAPAHGAKDHPYGPWKPLDEAASDVDRAARAMASRERFAALWGGKVRLWAKTLAAPRADIAIALQVIGRRDARQCQVEAGWGKDAPSQAQWVFARACPKLPEAGPDALAEAELAGFRAALADWKTWIKAYRGYRVDLRATNLQGADLSGLCFAGARLRGARLEGADLSKGLFGAADFSDSDLSGARLSGAQLQGADFSKARMEGTNLSRAQMQAAILDEARMEGAILRQSQMAAASFVSTRLEVASLPQSRLEAANLMEADLEQADLAQARLDGAYLSRSRLSRANLNLARLDRASVVDSVIDGSTRLEKAVFDGAGLKDLDCRAAALSATQISAAFGDASVLLPKGLTFKGAKWPKHWPAQILTQTAFETEWRKWQANPAGDAPLPDPAN